LQKIIIKEVYSMGQMNSRQLYYFTVIAETGSFTAGGKKGGGGQKASKKKSWGCPSRRSASRS